MERVSVGIAKGEQENGQENNLRQPEMLKEIVEFLRSRLSEIGDFPVSSQPNNPGRATFSDPLPIAKAPIPGVLQCNWKQFKNLLSPNNPRYSIMTLAGGQELPSQVMDESIERGVKGPNNDTLKQLTMARATSNRGPLIHRVRIQSAPILHVLNMIGGHCWDITKTQTFMRPFGFLIHHQEEVRKWLEAYQNQLGDVLEQPGADEEINSQSILQDIRAYVKFVDDVLLPEYGKFDGSCDGMGNVRFDELWYLFRPGDFVYIPGGLQANSEQSSYGSDEVELRGIQQLWRVCPIGAHDQHIYENIVYSELEGGNERSPPPSRSACSIRCYYLDFDGQRVVPVVRTLNIQQFQGCKSISELNAYPLRFLPDQDRLLTRLRDRGRHFMDCVRSKYMFYDGWIMLYEPDGTEAKGYGGNTLSFAERHAGEVIVDIEEAFKEVPNWRITHTEPRPFPTSLSRGIEPYRVITWTEGGLGSAVASHYEIIVENDDTQRFESDKFCQSDRFIGRTAKQLDVLTDLDGDYALLPRRILTYIISLRAFRSLDVKSFKHIIPQRDAFDQLQVEDPIKKIIRSLMDAHLKHKKILGGNPEIRDRDLIRGKGRGQVVLIQGAPGIGKTATVAAVAKAYNLPLITITWDDFDNSGDILRKLFSQASMWNCIVLLDEVDIVLSQRTQHDQVANIVVSYFLQLMETFDGMLFLTTNRPGTLDEAVKSRVQLHLCYKPLDLKQTLEIFKLNMQRLNLIEEKQAAISDHTPLVIIEEQILEFAEHHFQSRTDESGFGRWNGRQIQNAFLIASSLAHYEVAKDPRRQPQLRAEHFKEAERLTLEYDRARFKALGKSDSYLAHERSERYDGHEENRPIPPRPMTGGLPVSPVTMPANRMAGVRSALHVPSSASMADRSNPGSNVRFSATGPQTRYGEQISRDDPSEW
ncbi:hypothetical protein BX600DRAFT_530741 [Xylariales sp. PMI_506]|nr:hypothetical protein BX600DRAFT_530741 [Xylariales sp. PMI_506]